MNPFKKCVSICNMMEILQLTVLSGLYGLYVAHIYEILFQNHYMATGWWFVAKVSIDPIILILNALYFKSRLIQSNSSFNKIAFYGLLSEFVIHLIHFIVFINGRPVWLSLIFNTVDIAVIIIALYAISNLHTPSQNTHGIVLGTMFTLVMYKFTC